MKKRTKRTVSFLLLLGILLGSLVSCGGDTEEKEFVSEELPKQLEEAGAFSEKLEELEEEILLQLFEMDEEKVSACAGFASTGLTAEEVAVFEMTDEQAAKDGEALLKAHWEYQKESNVDYRPQEMPKLEKAVIERRGKTLLFLVAADYEAAGTVLK